MFLEACMNRLWWNPTVTWGQPATSHVSSPGHPRLLLLFLCWQAEVLLASSLPCKLTKPLNVSRMACLFLFITHLVGPSAGVVAGELDRMPRKGSQVCWSCPAAFSLHHPSPLPGFRLNHSYHSVSGHGTSQHFCRHHFLKSEDTKCLPFLSSPSRHLRT